MAHADASQAGALDGRVKTVSSLTNPLVKSLRGLSQKKNRDAEGLFLGEGLKLVTDALAADWPVQTLVYAREVGEQAQVKRAAEQCVAAGGRLLEVTTPVLAKITRRDNPQMVVGAFRQKLGALSPDIRGQTVWIALEEVRDPGNLGTIMRTADAVGASGVILIGATCDPWSAEAVRATMGSLFHVPLLRVTKEAFLTWVREVAAPLIGTHLSGAVDYRSLTYAEPSILLMGNEQAGLSKELAQQCDHLVKIPQIGQADSLNLAIATGVMLFEMRRARL